MFSEWQKLIIYKRQWIGLKHLDTASEHIYNKCADTMSIFMEEIKANEKNPFNIRLRVVSFSCSTNFDMDLLQMAQFNLYFF